jgi:hypothetical protein
VSPTAWAFSRSCALTDFPGCRSPAHWQETLASLAYRRWLDGWDARLRTRAIGRHRKTRRGKGQLLVVNWSGHAFQPTGVEVVAIPGLPADGRWISALVLLSVLDHVAAPVQTLRTLSTRLVPGGLLIATVAYWDAQGADCATGHESRKRIYNRRGLERLIHDDLRKIGLQTFGPIDWGYHGNVLGDHTLHSLVVTKKELPPAVVTASVTAPAPEAQAEVPPVEPPPVEAEEQKP